MLCMIFVSCKSTFKLNSGIIGSSQYYILPFNQVDDYPFYQKVRSAELTKLEIQQVEDIIQSRVKKTTEQFTAEMNKRNEIYEPNYLRQYLVVYDENGEKLVWINFMCGGEGGTFDYSKELITTADGGKCNFQIKVNLAQNKIINYHENGLA